MTEGEVKRQKIFDVYSKNLNILESNGILQTTYSSTPTYFCPICLNHFTKINEKENPLTLEDAPPKSLGGKSDILTCKKCNNTCGHKIDFHLTERLRELDNQNLIPGTEIKVKVRFNDDVLNGVLSADENGKLKMFYSNKNNHPEKLKQHMVNLEGGTNLNSEFLKSRVIPENLEYALLKTGYLLVFKKFGYSLIFEECYNDIRKQLLNPEKNIYTRGFWFNPPYPRELSGVYFICNKGIESLLSIFEVKTKFTSRMFGTILPLPIKNIKTVLENINSNFNDDDEIELELYPLEQNNTKYLDDIENIKQMKIWIKNKNIC